MALSALIVLAVIVAFVLLLLAKTVRVIPQARAGVVERLGRYSRTLTPGLTLVIPFIDRVKPLLDLREQAVTFEPQPVITEDNLVVNIDTVIYFQVTDPKSATYEIANPVNAIDLLTVTTLRNVIGGMTLEQTLTSRETINDQLRGILDEATGKWGIRVHRVELKAVDPPPSIKDTMEKQMRADREKRAAILQAEGIKQSQILTAEGEKQSAILKAEGQKQSAILAAEGQSKAIETVFKAIHEGNPDPQLLAYQYLQVLPQIAQGDANKVWVIPSELTRALGGLTERILPPGRTKPLQREGCRFPDGLPKRGGPRAPETHPQQRVRARRPRDDGARRAPFRPYGLAAPERQSLARRARGRDLPRRLRREGVGLAAPLHA